MSTTKTIADIHAEIKKFSPHPEKVKLLAVSKKQSIDKIRELVSQHQTAFGENYVQEALEKIVSLPQNIEWHLIGHLQSKKVNTIIGKFAYIHSVDSIKIAELIGQKSKALGVIQKVFIEVNLGNEETKTGFATETLIAAWSKLIQIDSIQIVGLMALPPASENELITRGYFRNLSQLQHDLRKKTDTSLHPLDNLSMGTSQDYPIALQEGATVIRIGTLLFGERV
ncbi:MAG: YggS family pyridoxal phosphate-dependent enzyme [Bdellovibrionaceae bacterium]|nr:YggS family pyridoxal phosphate-dependent enzyme [Pseudobdellovibrionaceae bacterium]